MWSEICDFQKSLIKNDNNIENTKRTCNSRLCVCVGASTHVHAIFTRQTFWRKLSTSRQSSTRGRRVVVAACACELRAIHCSRRVAPASCTSPRSTHSHSCAWTFKQVHVYHHRHHMYVHIHVLVGVCTCCHVCSVVFLVYQRMQYDVPSMLSSVVAVDCVLLQSSCCHTM